MLKFPPIIVMMKRYRAMEEVLMIVGVRSTIIAEATPINISPKTLEGMSDRKHHGTERNRAPAANGASIS